MKKVELTPWRMIEHLAMGNKHSMIEMCVVSSPNTELHRCEIMKETHTPVNKNGQFKKSSHYFYLNQKNSKIFRSIESLLNSYKCHL